MAGGPAAATGLAVVSGLVGELLALRGLTTFIDCSCLSSVAIIARSSVIIETMSAALTESEGRRPGALWLLLNVLGPKLTGGKYGDLLRGEAELLLLLADGDALPLGRRMLFEGVDGRESTVEPALELA